MIHQLRRMCRRRWRWGLWCDLAAQAVAEPKFQPVLDCFGQDIASPLELLLGEIRPIC
jgi:hypothetical protein